MIKIDEAIIVEGKYDKIKLSSVVDAVIIVTNGFSIFNDTEKLNYEIIETVKAEIAKHPNMRSLPEEEKKEIVQNKWFQWENG